MTYIIAEIGLNHNNDLNIAKRLVDISIEAGANAVKFQTFRKDRFPAIEHLRMPEEKAKRLFWYCEDQDIDWFSTPFDFESINFLLQIGMKKWKIPSGLITHYEYLKRVSGCPGQKILSTGMSDLAEVNIAIGYVGRINLVLLHCTSIYPTPYDEVNLSAMYSLREQFMLPIGLSDHTPGIIVPIAAVAMGAEVIEKHVTLDKSMPGPDHKASIEPHELRSMVTAIRNVEKSIGNGTKYPTRSEMNIRGAIRERMNG